MTAFSGHWSVSVSVIPSCVFEKLVSLVRIISFVMRISFIFCFYFSSLTVEQTSGYVVGTQDLSKIFILVQLYGRYLHEVERWLCVGYKSNKRIQINNTHLIINSNFVHELHLYTAYCGGSAVIRIMQDIWEILWNGHHRYTLLQIRVWISFFVILSMPIFYIFFYTMPISY